MNITKATIIIEKATHQTTHQPIHQPIHQTNQPKHQPTVAICDTGSKMNSNRENIVLYSINYCLHLGAQGAAPGFPRPPPLLDEVIFKIATGSE